MPFQEDLAEFLDVDSGFASEALIIKDGGEECLVRGIFSSEYVDIDSGMAGISGDNPIFECAEDDIAGVCCKDFLCLNGKDYRICEIRPDGTGWVVLGLEEQDSR